MRCDIEGMRPWGMCSIHIFHNHHLDNPANESSAVRTRRGFSWVRNSKPHPVHGCDTSALRLADAPIDIRHRPIAMPPRMRLPIRARRKFVCQWRHKAPPLRSLVRAPRGIRKECWETRARPCRDAHRPRFVLTMDRKWPPCRELCTPASLSG